MKHISVLSRKRYVNSGLLALVLALGLLLLMPLVGQANTVTINDAARVLNASQVRTEAANLPDPINIYTTNTFNGSKSTFDQQARSHITSSNLLVMAIDTAHKHLAIVGGSNVPLSNSQYTDATQAFVSAYSNNNSYTAATIASISSLRSALGATANGSVPGSSSANGGVFSGLLGTLLCVGLIILVIAGVFFLIGRRMFGFGRGRRAMPMDSPMPYNQPYNQGYNQGYPPNYGGPYNQGQGMNPWMAGGLGAAAGGLIGYELGKGQGEDQMREQGQYQGGGGNDFGGGSSADFGGNNGGDFGGGSGADFGGGGGGDFGGGGGGGDFGGGGGGGDF